MRSVAPKKESGSSLEKVQSLYVSGVLSKEERAPKSIFQRRRGI
jgi:hypothetical protein